MIEKTDVVVVGAGAAGLMCAIEAGKRGRRVIVLDRAEKPGRKIMISGGGRCNFSNIDCGAEKFVSHNPDFCRSALSRYTHHDFLDLMQKHGVGFTEEADGRLFCVDGARAVHDMLLRECEHAGVSVRMGIEVGAVESHGVRDFRIRCGEKVCQSRSLLVATGGLSAPTVACASFGYDIARQFGLKVWPLSPGLVPLVLSQADKTTFSVLAGIGVEVTVSAGKKRFSGEMLFTHRGLSGPVILQMSLYRRGGEDVTIDFFPGTDLVEILRQQQQTFPKRKLKSVLVRYLPKRLVAVMVPGDLGDRQMQTIPHNQFRQVSELLGKWTIMPAGVAGYDSAEVTMGGVDCNGISSKSMETNEVEGLFFAGEVLDVTGRLGGYNLQWAWSSGWCAGQYA